MRFIVIFLFLITTSCDSEKTDATIILEEYSRQNKSLLNNSTTDTTVYRNKGGEYKVLLEKFPLEKSLHYVKGFYLNHSNPYGTYFRFDPYGKMDNYYFLCGDGKRNTYQIDFSIEKDKYHELGNAYVDFYAPNVITDTNNYFTLLFTSFPRRNIEAYYSVDKNTFQKLNLQLQGLDPFTNEAVLNLSKQEIENGIVLKVKSNNLWFPLLGLQDEKETTDTLFLLK